MGLFGLFNKKKKETLDKGLEKTKQSVFSKLARAVAGKSKVDDEVLDDLEEVLITSDVGVDTSAAVFRTRHDWARLLCFFDICHMGSIWKTCFRGCYHP